MNNKLNTKIQSALQAKVMANENLTEMLKSVQANCNHEIVAEVPWDTIGSAVRICLHCRIIEEGSHWSGGNTWSEKEYNVAILGNSSNRVITPITRNEFYGLRL